MKKYIFIIAILTLKIITSNLQAEECFPTQFYIGGFGGLNFNSFRDYSLKKYHGIGVGGGACVGIKYKQWRAEIELSHRTNTARKFVYKSYDHPYDTQGRNLKMQTSCAMVNLIYEFDLKSRFVPYFGFGLGYSSNKYKIKHRSVSGFWNTSRNKPQRTESLAVQEIIGVSYKFSEKFDVGIEYKFLKSICEDSMLVALNFRKYF
jgi:opacity protein-like surface antigen